MAGQPASPSVTYSFDCSVINVFEPGGAQPTTIVPATSSFIVSANFEFDGPMWVTQVRTISFLGAPHWRVQYYAESLGPGAEMTLGNKTGNILDGVSQYGAPDTNLVVAPGTLTAGLYKLSCVVDFPPVAGNPGQMGVTGFFEGPVIQIY